MLFFMTNVFPYKMLLIFKIMETVLMNGVMNIDKDFCGQSLLNVSIRSRG